MVYCCIYVIYIINKNTSVCKTLLNSSSKISINNQTLSFILDELESVNHLCGFFIYFLMGDGHFES
jgi:hypothetical protein